MFPVWVVHQELMLDVVEGRQLRKTTYIDLYNHCTSIGVSVYEDIYVGQTRLHVSVDTCNAHVVVGVTLTCMNAYPVPSARARISPQASSS